MWWFKMPTDFYDAAALVRAGEAAEILYVRAQAWAAQEETHGVVPREQMPRLAPTRTQARVKALVREGLLEVHPDGWRVLGGLKQETAETVATKRQQSAERTRKWRERNAQRTRDAASDAAGDASRDGSPLLTREPELEAAYGSSSAHEPPQPLPGPVDILRSRLEASGLVVRWDTLRPEQLDKIQAALTKHGDEPLVKAALGQHRPDDPAKFAGAWVDLWTYGMPEPGRHLGAVTHPPCRIHGTKVSPAGVCSSCVADQRAGDR